MTEIYFVTGTDTNIGKTTACVELLKKATIDNKSAIGLKPIATGCFSKNNQLYNSDALLLQEHSNININYDEVNPYRFKQPVSPHLVNTNNIITAKDIVIHCLDIINKYQPDLCYIEGAGGWLCPLNNNETFADIAKILSVPIILVIGIKLGCLNHGILTYKEILNSNLKLHGWIANHVDPEAHFFAKQNIDYLLKKTHEPLLFNIEWSA